MVKVKGKGWDLEFSQAENQNFARKKATLPTFKECMGRML